MDQFLKGGKKPMINQGGASIVSTMTPDKETKDETAKPKFVPWIEK